MSHLEKNCAVCGRVMEWRKAWEKNWESIKYCSDACRKNKSKMNSSHLENEILSLLKTRSRESTICPSEVLTGDDKNNKLKMEEVRQAARRLVHQDKIEITQKGQVVNPSNFKGPIRLKLKNKDML